MEKNTIPVQIRWSDIDANRHLRHSAYYDFGASARIQILASMGLTVKKLEELAIGPVLLREEAVFRREVKFEDQIRISTELLSATRDYTRWSIRHELTKQDGTLAATITIDGAWIDMNKRKFGVPDEFICSIFEQFPRVATFTFIDLTDISGKKQ